MIAQEDSGLVEQRRLLFFTLNYYWMDTGAYLKSRKSISLLRTHDELPEGEYFLKIRYKTILIDLSQTKEEIYAAFDNTGARYKINKAIKSGIKVKRAETAAEKQKFYDFYQKFIEDPKRKNKILALQQNELDKLNIFNAFSAEGEYLGGIGLLPSPDGRYLLYKYAATLHRFCENELLLWHAIQFAKDAGYSWFDMSWFRLTEDKESDQYRLYQFKKKFGGNMVDFYSYVRFRGRLILPGLIFKVVLKHLFADDINNVALLLKRLKLFK